MTTNDTFGTTNTTKGTAVPINVNSSANTAAPGAVQQTRSPQVMTADENNSKLLKGILIGGVIGGVFALLDSATRNQVKGRAVDLKDSSKDIWMQVKENPGEVKDQMVTQFKSAADTLKQAITDAQNLYERVNEDVFGKVNKVMDVSSEAVSAAGEVKGELADIGSKVKEAGSELADTVNLDKSNDLEENNESASKSSRTGTASLKTDETDKELAATVK
jgi:gas vesicle protein